jgi:membrane-associated phospholipid phosphatase
MESLWNSGISLILWLQQPAWLLLPMKFFSFLGSEEFFMLLLPVLYWSVDTSLGMRVGLTLMLNVGINDVFKMAMHGPRPYWFSPQVQALSAETSFGVPSGHSQNAVVIWGTLANWLRTSTGWAVAIFFIVMIGISRLYLGVHFPHDVLLGWTLGAIVLWLVNRYWESVEAWAKAQSLARQILWSFGASMLMLSLSVVTFFVMQGWQMPAEWLANISSSAEPELPTPISLGSALTSSGVLFGLLAGLAWLRTKGGFRADGTLDKRVLRYALGLVGVLIFWYGLGLIFPRGEELVPSIFRYVRYSLVGLWVSAGAPYLFLRVGLAAPKN